LLLNNEYLSVLNTVYRALRGNHFTRYCVNYFPSEKGGDDFEVSSATRINARTLNACMGHAS